MAQSKENIEQIVTKTIQDFSGIGRSWAQTGLSMGKTALENGARTLQTTANTLETWSNRFKDSGDQQPTSTETSE